MSIIKGDIKRALGFKSVMIGEIEIDLSKTTAKDIVEFQELPIKLAKGKTPDQLTSDDLIAANELQTQWFMNYFKDKEPELNDEEIKLFVVKNKAALQKEFTIGFGIKSRNQYESDESKAQETLSKKE